MIFERINKKRQVQIIGRREMVNFPDLGLFGLVAKIDTGANTTALHCHDVRVEDGVLYFKLLDESHPEYDDREHRFVHFEEKLFVIRSANRNCVTSFVQLLCSETVKYVLSFRFQIVRKCVTRF